MNPSEPLKQMSFLEDSHSHAKTSPTPANGRALQGAGAGYGWSFGEPLCHFDPATSSWRTSQLSISGDLIPFSETWPRAGTMRNGKCYPRMPLVRLIFGSGSSLWPTPASQDWQPICWKRSELLVQGKPARPAKAKGGCSNLQDTVGMVWLRCHGQTIRPKRGEMPRANPGFWEYLMGFPNGFTDCGVSATPSSPKSRRKSDG